MGILPKYITAAEASALLGISPREIYVLFNSGFLKGAENDDSILIEGYSLLIYAKTVLHMSEEDLFNERKKQKDNSKQTAMLLKKMIDIQKKNK